MFTARIRLQCSKKSFRFAGDKIYNELPIKIRDASTLNDFNKIYHQLFNRLNIFYFITIIFFIPTHSICCSFIVLRFLSKLCPLLLLTFHTFNFSIFIFYLCFCKSNLLKTPWKNRILLIFVNIL